MEVPMKTFLIAAAIALMAVPCYAQGMGQGMGNGKKHQTQEQTAPDQKKKSDDKGYNAALSRIPDQQYDPWKGVR
jgi:hypothetical protein